MKNLDTLDKVLIPVILTGFVFIVSLYLGMDIYVGSAISNEIKVFMVFYMTLLLITLVIIAVFVTNRSVKMPMIELTNFLDKIENDQYELFDKKYNNSDIDKFVIQVNKLISYLGNKDKKTNNLIYTLKDSNKSLEEYKKAVDASAIIAKFDNNGILTYVNDKFLDISKYDEERLLGQKYNLLKHESLDFSFFENLWKEISSKKIWIGEIRNKNKNNEDFIISSVIVPMLDYNNEIIEYLSFSIDITDHIHSIQKAKESEASKSIFLATMSHEIRTPLNGILGFSKLLENAEQIPKREKSYIDIINNSAKSLLGIINDILDISKIESGKLVLEERLFNPFKEFEPTIELFVAKANEKDIDILFYIDPTLPNEILGDPLKIKQVLSNLIGNAIKFTPKNGNILIKIEIIEKDDNTVKILFSIKDSGIGIPIEKQKTVFLPFSQADSSVTREYGGTGLGLSISSNIISIMGSKIELNSKENLGSEFYFDIDFEYKISENLYPQIDKNSKIAIFTYEDNSISQIGIVKKYLSNYTSPSIIDCENEINNYTLAIGRYEDLIKFDLTKIHVPLIFICDRDDENIDFENKFNTIKSPINQSKLYDSIISILKPDIEKVDLVNKETYKNSSFNCLIVEDNLVNQKLMEVMLMQKNINSKSVGNGLLALEEIKLGNVYDIIFMDINMPVMNGIEATLAIIEYEKDNNLKHTPIVSLTANAVAGDKEKYLSIGMDDYIPKPFEEYMLNNILKKYLSVDKKSEKFDLEKKLLNQNNFEYSIEQSSNALGLNITIFKTILKTFIDSIDEDLNKLKQEIENSNNEGISQIAHKIKGASGNLKINNIYEITKEIEINSMNNIKIDYNNYFTSLEICVSKIKKTFEESS